MAAGVAPGADPERGAVGNADHALDPLLKQFGSQERVMQAIGATLPKAIQQAGYTSGTYTVVVMIGGQTITVSGKIVGGVVRIGTVYIGRR